jgi:hypothetical protein
MPSLPEPAPPKPGRMSRAWRWFLARFRLDMDAVCEMSRGRGLDDFHDYPDTAHGYPDHFGTLTCVRCGKEFVI